MISTDQILPETPGYTHHSQPVRRALLLCHQSKGDNPQGTRRELYPWTTSLPAYLEIGNCDRGKLIKHLCTIVMGEVQNFQNSEL